MPTASQKSAFVLLCSALQSTVAGSRGSASASAAARSAAALDMAEAGRLIAALLPLSSASVRVS